ncbi:MULTISPECIES: caspase family protein [unclassified Crossiella]|uniref:caspase family protein n=1 Tax=unclassified Crossiella TaxID=2620835 RepID=UPI001FFF966C|nr:MULTISPECIES: caspase family protein [unclassified Crossiella]MCK2245041.1 caspase family protein [Crossiella sp. S99.2]MCK2258622.1 caspase family protein [Crossiella sp. S99.1]
MPTTAEPSLSRAVLIGTSEYADDQDLSNLPAVRHNLSDLLAALTDPVTGILNWAQCTVVDTPDSPKSMLVRLEKAANQARDLLLVYYAGHGLRHDQRERLYLTVRESRSDQLLGSAVPFDSMREIIENSKARTRLLLLDCCYSGLALGAMSGGSIGTRDVLVQGTTVITSSPRNKISHSPLGERNTAFTNEVIKLLRNGSPLPEEPLTVQELYRSVFTALAQRGLPSPKMSSGDTSGDLLLRRPPPVVVPQPPLAEPPPPPLPWPEPPRPPEPAVAPPVAEARTDLPEPTTSKDTGGRGIPSAAAPVAEPVGTPSPASLRTYLPEAGRLLVTFLLWLGVLTFFPFGIDSLVTSVIGSAVSTVSPAGSVGTSVFAFVVVGLCAGGLYRRHRHQQRTDRPRPALADVNPVLAQRLNRATVVLLFVVIVLLAIAVIGIMQTLGQDRDRSSSPGAIILWAEGFGGCGYLLYRRTARRSRGVATRSA